MINGGKNLKATQTYPLLFGASIASVFHQHRAAAIHTAAGIWYSCYDPATLDDLLCEENCDSINVELNEELEFEDVNVGS